MSDAWESLSHLPPLVRRLVWFDAIPRPTQVNWNIHSPELAVVRHELAVVSGILNAGGLQAEGESFADAIIRLDPQEVPLPDMRIVRMVPIQQDNERFFPVGEVAWLGWRRLWYPSLDRTKLEAARVHAGAWNWQELFAPEVHAFGQNLTIAEYAAALQAALPQGAFLMDRVWWERLQAIWRPLSWDIAFGHDTNKTFVVPDQSGEWFAFNYKRQGPPPKLNAIEGSVPWNHHCIPIIWPIPRS